MPERTQGETPPMLYHIRHWNPQQEMSGAGFEIELYPAWRDAVAASGLTQANIDNWIRRAGPAYLDGHYGRDDVYDHHSLRIQWGEWGPEHITVPGNGCGLDIDRNGWRGRPRLLPHNVDSITQASLLLTLFVYIAGCMVDNYETHEEDADTLTREAP